MIVGIELARFLDASPADDVGFTDRWDRGGPLDMRLCSSCTITETYVSTTARGIESLITTVTETYTARGEK